MRQNLNLFSGLALVLLMTLGAGESRAQKIDEARMERDIRVAENVLATLIRQKLEGTRTFFQLNVIGSYQAGYGVTFTLPPDYTTPIVFGEPSIAIWNDAQRVSTLDEYNFPRVVETPGNTGKDWKLKDRRQLNMDSLRDYSNGRLIEAAKDFLADYGDMLSQVPANERIIITNKGDQPRMWVSQLLTTSGRTHLSIEVSKSDLNQYKQNKISREQLMDKIKAISAESVNEAEPDLELLGTIFNRLYRQDLSKTYFVDSNISFERLKDFGVVYYMHVISSYLTFNNTHNMPTVGLRDIDQASRDAKVKEIYPVFENELKENIIEYGRTLKSLKDDEVLIFNVKVTRCDDCGIPSSLEYSIKGSDLRDFNSGKADKKTTLSRLTIRKEGRQ